MKACSICRRTDDTIQEYHVFAVRIYLCKSDHEAMEHTMRQTLESLWSEWHGGPIDQELIDAWMDEQFLQTLED